MANKDHISILLEQGNDASVNRQIDIDNATLDLTGAKLSGVDFSGFDLCEGFLDEVDLSGANLSGTNLSGCRLTNANLTKADLRGAKLYGAQLQGADLSGADLSGANLDRAYMWSTNLTGANLTKADLTEANLSFTILNRANLTESNLSSTLMSETKLQGATLIKTIFKNAKLHACWIYGVSTWDVNLEGAIQQDLMIYINDNDRVWVDGLEVAQFIYLLLNNSKLRNVIDTITGKAVLILGRFGIPERKDVIDSLKKALRERGYLSIVFDFDPLESLDLGETVEILARLSKFIIADISDPSSALYELGILVNVVEARHIPLQPIIVKGQIPFAMSVDFQKKHWILPLHTYESQDTLLAELDEKIIKPIEQKIQRKFDS